MRAIILHASFVWLPMDLVTGISKKIFSLSCNCDEKRSWCYSIFILITWDGVTKDNSSFLSIQLAESTKNRMNTEKSNENKTSRKKKEIMKGPKRLINEKIKISTNWISFDSFFARERRWEISLPLMNRLIITFMPQWATIIC